jgi:hypothetical protein
MESDIGVGRVSRFAEKEGAAEVAREARRGRRWGRIGAVAGRRRPQSAAETAGIRASPRREHRSRRVGPRRTRWCGPACSTREPGILRRPRAIRIDRGSPQDSRRGPNPAVLGRQAGGAATPPRERSQNNTAAAQGRRRHVVDPASGTGGDATQFRRRRPPTSPPRARRATAPGAGTNAALKLP